MKGYRKLVLFLLVETFACAALWAGKLPPEVWASFSQWAFAAFVLGNIGEHMKSAFVEKKDV